jgi:GT2 family glycosyltransferase
MARAVRAVTAPVTAVVVTYRESELGRPAIASLERQTQPPAELLVIANDPEAGGFESSIPMRVLHPGGNLGYPNSCNVAAAAASQPWLFFLNPDAEAAPDCLERLLAAADERTAIVGAQVLLPDGRVNAGDNPVHVTGLSWSGRYLEPAEHGPPRETAAVSGAGLITRTEVFRELGGHCPAFFLYVDDTDMAWRARLGGWRVVFCPEATISHDYEFDKGPSKWQYLEHNRLWMVLSNYSALTLALLAPLLLAAEAGIALQARRDGWWPQKLQAWRELVRGRRDVARWRRQVQAHRAVGDRAIVARMQGEVHTPLVESALLDRVNRWMEFYRRAVLRLLRR